MLKQNINRAILGIVLIPLLGIGMPVFAQTAPTVTGVATPVSAVAVAAEIGTVVPQPVDEETADLVQLSNLRLQSVSGRSLPVVLTATYDFGIKCQRYESDTSNKASDIVCPLPPTVLYQIRVDADTLLFLRTRVRAKISDFEIGDMVNVYGFMDKASRVVDALVLRDLDKPIKETPVQLNNVQVVSLPTGGAPTTFTVARDSGYPCWNFENGGTGRPAPCPLSSNYKEYQGYRSSDNAKSITGSVAPSLYPIQERYLIEITTATNVIDRNRSPIKPSALAIGDKLNIYGARSNNLGSIRADVIRDLSKPTDKEFGGLRVTVTASNVICLNVMGPCGIIYKAKVQIYGDSGEEYKARYTDSGSAYFEKLRPGTYKVLAEAGGYKSGSEAATVTAGQDSALSISLNEGPIIPTANVSVSSLSPNYGPIGTSVTITGRGFTLTGNRVNFGGGVVMDLPSIKERQYITFNVPGSLNPLCRFSTPACAMLSRLTTPGTYPVSVTNANGTSNAVNFTVTSGANTSPLTVLSPNGGETWTKGTTQTIRWQDNMPVPICSTGADCVPYLIPKYDIMLSSYYPPCITNICPTHFPVLRTIAQGVYGSSYDWSVGKRIPAAYSDEETIAPDGSYTIQVCRSGTDFCDSTDSYFKIVSVVAGAPTISGVSGPTVLRSGEQGTWTVTASDPNNGTLSYSVLWGDEGGYYSGTYTAPVPLVQQTATFTHSYNIAGNYSPKFTVTNASGLSAQTSLSVNVGVVASSAPAIFGVTPQRGPIGTRVTISGSGFSTDSQVNFGSLGKLSGVISGDAGNKLGNSFTFTVPDQILAAPGCIDRTSACTQAVIEVTPGIYPLSIVNLNGTSNAVNFTVTVGPTASTPALSAARDSASAPSAQLVMGSTQNNLASFRFTETSNLEAIQIKDLNIYDNALPNGVLSSFSLLRLYQGSTLVGATVSATLTATGSTGSVYRYTVHFATPITVPRSGFVVLTLKGDVSAYPNATNSSTHTFYLGGTSQNINASGVSSGLVATISALNPVGSTHTITRSALSVSGQVVGATANRIPATVEDIGSITFTASTAGSLALNQIKLTVTGNLPSSAFQSIGSGSDDLKLYDPAVGTSAPGTVSNTACGGGSCIFTFNLGFGTNGYVISAGSSKTFNIRINSMSHASVLGRGVAPTIAVAINRAADVTYADALDGSGALTNLLPTSVPLSITHVSYVFDGGSTMPTISISSPKKGDVWPINSSQGINISTTNMPSSARYDVVLYSASSVAYPPVIFLQNSATLPSALKVGTPNVPPGSYYVYARAVVGTTVYEAKTDVINVVQIFQTSPPQPATIDTTLHRDPAAELASMAAILQNMLKLLR